ncbi:MAG: short-chain dehydrogenase, partial [Acidobacteriota bacterium]
IDLLRKVAGTMKSVTSEKPEVLSAKCCELISKNEKLRNEILSIGIAILMPDGTSLLRGNEMKIPPYRGEDELEINEDSINHWAKDGWVDLRVSNMAVWQSRLNAIMAEAQSIPLHDTSSNHVRTKSYWNNFEKIDIGKVVSWIFIHEEKGMRMKA